MLFIIKCLAFIGAMMWFGCGQDAVDGGGDWGLVGDTAGSEESGGGDETGSFIGTDSGSDTGTGVVEIPGVGWGIGGFTVEIEADRDTAPWMRVTHDGQGKRVLWESAPGQSFLAAGRGTLDVDETRGSFTLDEQIHKKCFRQRIDEITPKEGGLLVSGAFTDKGCDAVYELFIDQPVEGHLRLDASVTSESEDYNRVFLRYASNAQEKFFGFGESFSHLDLKGRKLPVLTQEQGIGRGKQPLTFALNLFSRGSGGSWFSTYIAAPHYLTSQARSLFLENVEVSYFDMSADNIVEVEVTADRMIARVLAGATPLELVERYTEYTGRMPPLPDWLNAGAVVGLQGGTGEVLEKLTALEAYDCPVAAFWLQDWVGKRRTKMGEQLWWNWELSEEQYPDWDGMVELLAEKGIRVMTYVNPFLVDVSSGRFERNLFQEAIQAGYLVKDRTGAPYMITNTDFDAGLVDLTNEEARVWFKEVLRDNVLGAGASGWMADFSEALPFDGVLASGEPAARLHNTYPEMWVGLNRELIEEEGLLGEAVFFSRAGFTRSPGAATLFWEGDQLNSWDEHDGLKSAVKGLLSSGLSGFSLNHSDIGGYTTIAQWYAKMLDPFGWLGIKTTRSEELLARWSEANAFTAVYRTHEGLLPDENAQFYSNGSTYAHFARFAKVYAALAFYREVLMDEAYEKGTPLARHPMLHYPEDPEVYDLSYQWLLGREFMVAPVLDPGDSTVPIYLPAGRWVHVWSGEAADAGPSGGWFEVDAPLGEPAVFYREGSEVGQTFVSNLRDEGIID